MMNHETCVVNGAKLLDLVQPEWYSQIDCASLDMGDCYHCVLGQMFGKYDIGLARLGFKSIEDRYTYGFSRFDANHWEDLTNLWREQVAYRRLKDMSQTGVTDMSTSK